MGARCSQNAIQPVRRPECPTVALLGSLRCALQQPVASKFSRLAPSPMSRPYVLAIICVCSALFGCASTKFEITGSGLKEPLCQPGAEKLSVLVYWGPQWRTDQKEPTLREAAALRGIQDFFAGSNCVVNADIRRLPSEGSMTAPSDEQLLRLASAPMPMPDRGLLIIVRELGPKLLIGIPVLVEGGTEVIVDVRVLNVHTSESMANVRTHWQNGGTFIIKGVKTLDQDMSAALRATLMAAAPSK